MRRVTALLVGWALLIIAACGGDDDGTSGAPPQSAGDDVLVSDDPLEVTDITVAVPGYSASWLPLFIGMHEGIFAKHGLEVTQVQAPGTRSLELYLAGEIHISFAAPVTVSTLLARDQPVSVYTTMYPEFNQRLMVESSIESLEDLEGEVVGTTSLFGAPAQATRALIEAEGLDLDDFNFQGLGATTDMLSAMVSGNAAAGAFTEPLATLAEQQGFVELYDLTDEEMPYAQAGGPLIADPAWVEDNPNTAKAFLRAFFESMQIALTDPETARAVLEEEGDIDPEEGAEVLDNSYAELVASYPAPGWELTDRVVDAFKEQFENPDQIDDPSLVVPGEEGVLDDLHEEGFFEKLLEEYGEPPEDSYAAETSQVP